MTSFNLLARQRAHPRGFLGRYVARKMAQKAEQRGAWILSHLDLRPADYVLEIGYAAGVDMARVAEKLTHGLIIGLDHSETMFHMAFRRNKKHLDTGRMQLQVGPASKLPFAYPYFDKVFSIDVASDFLEMKRVLRPGGIAVVAVTGLSEKKGATLERDFRAAGFADVNVSRDGEMFCLRGVKN